MQALIESFRTTIRHASGQRRPLRLRGAGTKDFYGNAPQGEPLDTRQFCGIVDYDPTELVITARCGTPLAEIEAELAQRRQLLAFEAPRFGAGGTLGGAIAAGLSGPRRQAVGALRDFVLGVQMMDGRGDLLNFGGRVVKNVAGYDVSRLMAGSLGTLGLILEVSLKVLPMPFAEQSLCFEMDEPTALARLNAWGGQPLPISASAWADGVLRLRLSGAGAAVAAARQKLGGEWMTETDAAAFWKGLRDHSLTWFDSARQGATLWRLAVPSTTPALPLFGRQLIEWGGGQRWWLTDASPSHVRTVAAAARGHATLFRNGGDGRHGGDVFTALPQPLLDIHQRLKDAFDPARIFNPGRLYAQL
ncbi:glycolate oxidase subunit GlcE [Cupriavidus sp. AcVe19-1a]|uniref:glycolate oxidase subunit GlcE n=1 Tax=Cupriavidus sp. AcVe19-1a TaxID=2821359 RepID=UPI001AE64116|nr:glycolate oxidase subunit GlcE [Cupriavidus sp. AcVe19-1a]MBP0633199.1 glycolate oxidase subunit GlcE [Cupriavidus sp. AcVe19-1a]